MGSVLAFGEILWDVFEAERSIGGAPFNFAAHFAALGGESRMCSALGRDELGAAARLCLRQRGIADALVAESELPTGACQVTRDADGTPHYALLRNVAYDAIPMPDTWDGADLLYLGTLAQRSLASRTTAKTLAESGRFRDVFVDVNIRKPDISREVLLNSLRYATIVKCSREEADCLTEYGILPPQPDGEALLRALANAFPRLRFVLLTLDRDGAMLYDAAAREVLYSMRPVNPLRSAVGAGDSFCAAFAWNLLNGRSPAEALNRGVLLSDYVVTQLCAVPELPPELLRQLR